MKELVSKSLYCTSILIKNDIISFTIFCTCIFFTYSCYFHCARRIVKKLELLKDLFYHSRKDWGAILLIDERFGRGDKYKKGLSRWVRGRCRTYAEFKSCLTSLGSFAEARRLNPCPEPVETPSRTEERMPATPNTSVIDGNQSPVVGGCLDSVCRDSCKIVKKESDTTDEKESYATIGKDSCSIAKIIVSSEGEVATAEGTNDTRFRTNEFCLTPREKCYATGCQESRTTSNHQSTSTIVRPFDSATPIIKREWSIPKNLTIKLNEDQGSAMQLNELQNLDNKLKVAHNELPHVLEDKQTHVKGDTFWRRESVSPDIASRGMLDKDRALAENMAAKSSKFQSREEQATCDLKSAIITPTFKAEAKEVTKPGPLSVVTNSLTKPRYNSFDNLIKPVLTGHSKLFRTNRMPQAVMTGQGRLFKPSQAEREAIHLRFENKRERDNHTNLLDIDDGFLEDLDAEKVGEYDRVVSTPISEIEKSKSKVSERKEPVAKVETPILFSEEDNEIGDFEDKFWDGVDDSEMSKVLSENAGRIDQKENEEKDKDLQKRKKSSTVKKEGLVDKGREEEGWKNVSREAKMRTNLAVDAQNKRPNHQCKETRKPNNELSSHDSYKPDISILGQDSKKYDKKMCEDSNDEVAVDCNVGKDLLNTSRRRSSSRKKSNVRMASKKVEPLNVQNDSIRVKDDVYKVGYVVIP